jgi:hypothetical protein
MTATHRYEAFWIPGLEDDIDRDQGLAYGYQWLIDAERKYGGTGMVVMYAVRMVGNAPLLAEFAARWEFYSLRSRGYGRRSKGPVLAIWPTDRTLEFAEQLALGTALCVIPGTSYDSLPWIRRTGARCLVEGFSVAPGQTLPDDIGKTLDSLLSFGGHNEFLGGGEKEMTITALRKIAARPDAPSREAVEEYLAGSGQTRSGGVHRAGEWYDEIRRGKRHRDYRGRVIS